jgi:hypothetical protein
VLFTSDRPSLRHINSIFLLAATRPFDSREISTGVIFRLIDLPAATSQFAMLESIESRVVICGVSLVDVARYQIRVVNDTVSPAKAYQLPTHSKTITFNTRQRANPNCLLPQPTGLPSVLTVLVPPTLPALAPALPGASSPAWLLALPSSASSASWPSLALTP